MSLSMTAVDQGYGDDDDDDDVECIFKAHDSIILNAQCTEV